MQRPATCACSDIEHTSRSVSCFDQGICHQRVEVPLKFAMRSSMSLQPRLLDLKASNTAEAEPNVFLALLHSHAFKW